jgi:general secretion pathway protein D
LDKRRPQVLIDVTLVEVTKSDTFTYDLNLVRGSPDLAGTSAVSGIKPGADSIGKFVKTGGSGLNAFYGDQQIQALLETMQSKNYGRVLAKPKLLVNDNEKGKIQTTDTTYVEVTSSIPVTSGAAGNQTNLVQTSVNYSPYKAGITLDITPHISEGELLRLDIVMTRSDFLKASATKPPDVRENQVDTKATLPNGSTVILGGMLKMNQVKGGSKVPLLGDIPLLGGLFRSINNEDTQSKLYVFVKAEIIRPAETLAQGMRDLQVLSERDRTAFERHEQEFQNREQWPGIKDKPTAPARVLDAR